MIHSFFCVIVEQKTYPFDTACLCHQLRKPKGEQCFLYDVCSPGLKFCAQEVCLLEISHATPYSQSKQAAMSALDYIDLVYRDIRMFIQLTQCCVSIWHLADA